MAPTVTSISALRASMLLSRLSFPGMASRSAGRPAVSEYPPTRPSRMAATAASLMCSGVSAVGLAQERKATSSTSLDNRVISWIAEGGMPDTRLETRAVWVIGLPPCLLFSCDHTVLRRI
jgi:hypothetical protein